MYLCSWYIVLIVNSELARGIKSDTAGIPALNGRVTEITEVVEELQVTKNGEPEKAKSCKCNRWRTEAFIAQLRREIIEWLSPLNFLKTQIDVLNRRQTGTGQWLLESAEFKDWFSGSGTTLWCPGIRMTYLKPSENWTSLTDHS